MKLRVRRIKMIVVAGFSLVDRKLEASLVRKRKRKRKLNLMTMGLGGFN